MRKKLIMCRLALSLTVFLACWAISSAEDPKPDAKEQLEKFIRELHQRSGRVNGAELTITAEVKDDIVHIKWTLDYTGFRQPLIIQKPMYPEYSYGATNVLFIVQGGKNPANPIVGFTGTTTTGREPIRAPKELFITVEKGKEALGMIKVPVAEVKKQLLAKWPEYISDEPLAALYVQMRHFPKERGEDLNLDAWTAGGNSWSGLYSAPVKVMVSKW